MEKGLIINLWKRGFTINKIANEYVKKYNKTIREEKKISKIEAKIIVEHIIFNYQVNQR